MAKANFEAPFTGVTGTIGRTDLSKGEDGGMSAVLKEIEDARPGDGHNRPYTYVYQVKKARSKTRSPAQIARAARYCWCDESWKLLSSQRILHLKEWWLWTREIKEWQLPVYQTWMKGCLSSLPETDLYRVFCWAGRYRFANTTGATINSQFFHLLDVPYLDPAGTDNEVWQLLPDNRLGVFVPRQVMSPGVLRIIAPTVLPGASIAWDVYSYPDV